MTSETILHHRLKRQHLLIPASEADYDSMFRQMSPVPTRYWVEPGSPPQIQHRFDFDDYSANDLCRRDRTLIKGRFQGGNVGYVFYEDLPLFKAAYSKTIKGYTEVDEIVLNVLHNEGPMNIGLIKEITGLLAKDISKAMQKLQKAFIVFEDQVDNEWDRAFYLLEDELSDLDYESYTKESAVCEVIKRFLCLNVWADEKMIKSFTKLTNKDIKVAIASLLEEDIIVSESMDEMEGYMLAEDADLADKEATSIPDDIFVLDMNDYLVKSHELLLKEQFGKSDYKTLHYILLQGRFVGRVLGNFRFGPHDIEDIHTDMDEQSASEYKARILEAVKAYYNHENASKRYNGVEV